MDGDRWFVIGARGFLCVLCDLLWIHFICVDLRSSAVAFSHLRVYSRLLCPIQVH